MKKFLVLLCVGCLMVGGCAQAEPKNTTETDEVATDAAIEGSTDVVSDAAIEPVDTEEDPTDDPLTDEYGLPIDPNSLATHVVTTHADKNAEPDNSVEYFPDVKNINDLENGTQQVMLYSQDYKKYNFMIEHRTFDFLKEGDTVGNFEAIGSYIKNEYLDEIGDIANEYEVLLDGYIDNTSSYNVTFLNNASDLPTIPENATEEELEAYVQQVAAINIKNSGFIIYRTIDDPNNGVTILYVEDADNGVLRN